MNIGTLIGGTRRRGNPVKGHAAGKKGGREEGRGRGVGDTWLPSRAARTKPKGER